MQVCFAVVCRRNRQLMEASCFDCQQLLLRSTVAELSGAWSQTGVVCLDVQLPTLGRRPLRPHQAAGPKHLLCNEVAAYWSGQPLGGRIGLEATRANRLTVLLSSNLDCNPQCMPWLCVASTDSHGVSGQSVELLSDSNINCQFSGLIELSSHYSRQTAA